MTHKKVAEAANSFDYTDKTPQEIFSYGAAWMAMEIIKDINEFDVISTIKSLLALFSNGKI